MGVIIYGIYVMKKHLGSKIAAMMGGLTFLALASSPAAFAADKVTPEEMTCQEFINLNPQAMLPVAWWMLHQETVYKGGDTVSLSETDTTSVPQLLEICKKNPQEKIYNLKDKLGK